MTRPLVANGSVLDVGLPDTIDTFVRPDGVVAGWQQRRAGGIPWVDAYESHPTQFDPWDIADNALSGTVTVRESGDTPQDNPIYPIDPDTGLRYGPNLVSHRMMWFDCGQDDDFEINLAWNVAESPYAFMQVSGAFGIDLDAPNFQNGCLYAYDVSILGGVSYWHNIPMTPDVASCKDPTYYTNLGGSTTMALPAAGIRWWKLVVQDGMMQAFFDGVAKHAPIARPAFTVGRTTVGVHTVAIAWPPDPNFVGEAAIWNQLVCDPVASAIVDSFHWRSLA